MSLPHYNKSHCYLILLLEIYSKHVLAIEIGRVTITATSMQIHVATGYLYLVMWLLM